MRRRRVLAAVGVAATSGCLRLAGGETRTRSAGQTATTTGRPSATPTSTATDALTYPTGLTAEGVDATLADGHLSALADTTFRSFLRATDATTGRTEGHRSARVGEASALVELQDGSDIVLYSTRQGNYWRQPTGAGATYGQERGTFEVRRWANDRVVRTYLAAGEWAPPEPLPGEDAFRIVADGATATDRLRESLHMSSLASFGAEGRVTEAGVVTDLSADVEYEAVDDSLHRFELRHRVRDVGAVSVAPPDWLSTARERVPEVTARLTDDRQFGVVEHTAGNPILQGTAVTLYDVERGGNAGHGQLREPFEQGTTLYLWRDGDQLRWARGEPPSTATPEPLESRYALWMDRNGMEYFGAVGLG